MEERFELWSCEFENGRCERLADTWYVVEYCGAKRG